ncbi:MAG: hypothetical protein CVU64_20920 [Deltaproteobacteria bacterium HGW-Deltaproteobacteria-21]|nr:MAG: hypothetical protein CVU64_20920 [Deltaproteobacteria bacterium HGW-Deltaproteobacteria-21]
MKKALTVILAVLFVFLMTDAASAKSYPGKKVLYIDSYHQGYGWSDGIEKGVKQGLEGTGVELKVFRMDTKRNTSDEFLKQAAQKAKAEIEAFKPDVVITADDNAAKAVIVPFYKDSSLPFVFCGLNWDASRYGFPTKNITGMVEVAPVKELLEQLKPYAKGNRLGVLATDVETNRTEAAAYKKTLGLQFEEYFCKDVADFKKGFLELQGKVDMILIDSDGGLYNNAAEELKAFFLSNTKVPTGTCYDFMTPYAFMGFTKLAEEQGMWSAGAALKILDGTAPSAIPLAKNKEGSLIINTKIGKAIGAQIPFAMLQSAAQVIE